MGEMSMLGRLRLMQVRFMAKAFRKLAVHRELAKYLSTVGRSDAWSSLLVGFNRKFETFQEADRCARSYGVPSHEHPGSVGSHLWLHERARPSDYPILFYLQRLLPEIRSVLDIGGSAGNLFYCYSKYLRFGDDFKWVVQDVPEIVELGRRIAEERHETRLRFIGELPECNHADAVIISGALHYFDVLPPELMRGLDQQPRHLFINRTPVVDGPSAYTIQDVGSYVAIMPARILSRHSLMEAMEVAGYELMDEWTVPDLSMILPFHPEASALIYSGFYFRARGPLQPGQSESWSRDAQERWKRPFSSLH